MEPSDVDLKQMDLYYSQKMAAGDVAEFEKRLSMEPDFADSWQQYQEGRAAIQLHGEQQLKQQWKDSYADYNAPILSMRRPTWRYAAIAAIVLVVAGLWALIPQSKQSPEQLFAANFDLPTIQERGGEDPDSLLQAATNWYNAAEYDSAVSIFQALLQQEDYDRKDAVRLRLGLSYMGQDQMESAVGVFAQNNQNSALIYDSWWYSAMANLALGKVEEAQVPLEALAKESKKYGPKATKILKAL